MQLDKKKTGISDDMVDDTRVSITPGYLRELFPLCRNSRHTLLILLFSLWGVMRFCFEHVRKVITFLLGGRPEGRSAERGGGIGERGRGLCTYETNETFEFQLHFNSHFQFHFRAGRNPPSGLN